ncbi:hypothetical protein D3C75_1155750 [compost metagenome]
MSEGKTISLVLNTEVYDGYADIYHSSEAAMPKVLANWLDIRRMSLKEINREIKIEDPIG